MEPPGPRGKKPLWDLIGKSVVIMLVFILIFSLAFFILVYLTKEPTPYPHYTAPIGAFDVKYDNSTDTYRLEVINLSDEILELDEVYFSLRNYKIRIEHDLPAVLDYELSNITFHDMDDDGLYSIGDEFYIDGNIVEPDTYFSVVWSRYGIVIMYIYFE